MREVQRWCLVLALTFCAAATFAGGQPRKQPQIAVVPKGVAFDFWLTVKAGAEAAGREAGAKILWKGPEQETDVLGQRAIIEDFINRGVDAIVMAACDARALVPTVKKAQAKKVPVVTIDSGLSPDISACFVATDNVAGARKAAQELARLIGDRGEVGLIPFVPGAATSIMRENGFKQEIKRYPNIKLVKTLYSQSKADVGMQVTQDMLTAHPNLKGIFACNEPGVVGAARALETRRLAGKVKLVGFDAAPSELDALKKGTVQALIVQNPFRMGYQGVKTALALLQGKKVPKRIDTGVTVVTKANLNKPEIKRIVDPLGKMKG